MSVLGLPLLPLVALLLFLLIPSLAFAAEGQISEDEAIRIADRTATAKEQEGKNEDLGSSAALKDGNWEVAYFIPGKQVAQVVVDAESGEVEEEWTGYQVAWKMARGYSGAFGHRLNAPYVFLPLCALFLIGLADWRRWRRIANLDLLVLLGFGASHFFFNRAEIGVSVPLQYPVLLYLLGRALWIGFRGRGEGLRPVWPATWLLIAALFLMGVRVGLNLADSGPIDVGYASVVGADRISHGEPIYGEFPEDVSQGDTYGPFNYLAYVPFELAFPWSGSWDDLPAAHGAAIGFDLAAFAFLILLGFRLRPGPRALPLAATLAFGWAAYPYSAYVLESNSNDTLVAALLLATLLVLARPIARGAMTALAVAAKFAPALLIPMLATYQDAGGSPDEDVRERKPRPQDILIGRPTLLFAGAFIAATALAFLWPAIDPGLTTVYDRTITYQTSRDSPFSIWGQVEWLEPLRVALMVGTIGLSLLLAFRPRRKSLIQVAALAAALMIALQLTMQHWFYLYVVWFFPLLLVAIAALEREPEARAPQARSGPSPARTSPPVPAG
ncbi:MAG: PepSY domain-containing protein [Solirubrobacterales bacterium]